MTTTRFFVYGNFCEGMQHFAKIQKFALSVVPARIQAKAFRLKIGLPVVLEQGQDWVPGQLIEVQASDILLGLWDEMLGFNPLLPNDSLSLRKEVKVQVQGVEQSLTAWVYFLHPEKLPVNAVEIPDGDWMRSLQESPSLISKLTDRQTTYIKRLGQSTGREIVPIDLPLYRELMNLELIVDKGRRLALSKLGQEVFRNLG